MKQLFDPEGPVMSALGKLADLVFCNILFCLCCLPVFTAGAALTALFRCTLSLAEDTEESLIFMQYFSAFRRGFKRSMDSNIGRQRNRLARYFIVAHAKSLGKTRAQ